MSPQWPRDIYSIYRAQNDDYPQNNDRLKIQNAMSNENIPYSNVFCWIRLGSKIQDSRCQGELCPAPWILNLGSEAYSTEYVLNTFEYGTLRFDHCILYFEPVVVLWIVVVLCSIDTTDFARALRDLTPVLLCEVTYPQCSVCAWLFQETFPLSYSCDCRDSSRHFCFTVYN